jgi:hypothetical protein
MTLGYTVNNVKAIKDYYPSAVPLAEAANALINNDMTQIPSSLSPP